MLWYCLTNIVDSKCFITTTLLCFITAFYCGYLMNGWENCMRSSLNSLNKQRVNWFYWIFFLKNYDSYIFPNVRLLNQQKYFMCVQKFPMQRSCNMFYVFKDILFTIILWTYFIPILYIVPYYLICIQWR